MYFKDSEFPISKVAYLCHTLGDDRLFWSTKMVKMLRKKIKKSLKARGACHG